MAKKKPAKAKTMNERRERFLIALPEEYRQAVEQLTTQTRRAITVEMQIALDAHLKANGIEPPKGEK